MYLLVNSIHFNWDSTNAQQLQTGFRKYWPELFIIDASSGYNYNTLQVYLCYKQSGNSQYIYHSVCRIRNAYSGVRKYTSWNQTQCNSLDSRAADINNIYYVNTIFFVLWKCFNIYLPKVLLIQWQYNFFQHSLPSPPLWNKQFTTLRHVHSCVLVLCLSRSLIMTNYVYFNNIVVEYYTVSM